MTSRTSSNKWVVFKGALKRLKWLSILYGVILFIQVPLSIWMQLSRQKFIQGSLWAEAANKISIAQMLFNPLEHLINLAVALVFGLIIFYYLQSERPSTFFHSLPIKRTSLYIQNLFAGLTLIWLPIVINAFLTYFVFNAFGVTAGQWHNPYMYTSEMQMGITNNLNIISMWQAVAGWLLLSMLMTGLFYVFTVFVGMFTGNILLQGALTLIGLFLPLGIYVLSKLNLALLLYGFSENIDGRNIEWLSPIVSYLNDQNYLLMTQEIRWYIWYLAAAVLCSIASIYLYKKRHAEAAGETLAAAWIRGVFKYGVTTCASLLGGLYFSSVNQNTTEFLYLGYFAGALLGYVIADMVAYKSFYFYKRWKGLLMFGAVFALLITSINLDVFGYQRYVPEQSEVKEVLLSNFSRDGIPMSEGLRSEENIRKVRELHQQIINMEAENREQEQLFNRNISNPEFNRATIISAPMRVQITYTMKNGAKAMRMYSIDINRYREFLYPIFSSEETKKSIYARLFKISDQQFNQIVINNHHLNKNVRIYKPEQIEEALAALRKDVLNVSYETAVEGKMPSQAVIEFVFGDPKRNYVSYHLNYYQEYKNFEAFLQKYEYEQDLFLNPDEVSSIIVNKVGSKETYEVKDKQQIEMLSNWCMVEDQRSYLMRQEQGVNKHEYLYYYGKIVMKTGNPIYVMFDSSPQAMQAITNITNSR